MKDERTLFEIYRDQVKEWRSNPKLFAQWMLVRVLVISAILLWLLIQTWVGYRIEDHTQPKRSRRLLDHGGLEHMAKDHVDLLTVPVVDRERES